MGRGAGGNAALACGLVSAQTMYANNEPALAYPIPVGVTVPVDHPIGTFALQYVAGEPVQFSEDVSKIQLPAPLNTLPIRWTFGDGTPPSTDVSPTHRFAGPGTFDVRIQVKDTSVSPAVWDDIDSAQIQVMHSVPADPPMARMTASATAVVQGGAITFDAAGSRPLAGSHLTYQWNFNDASTATGEHVTHTFSLTGSTFVALLVTDDRGVRSVATIPVAVVQNQRAIPTAGLTATTTSAGTGQSIVFDASSSQPGSEPAGDQIVKYVWDFGDGSAQQTTQGPTIAHAYGHTGQYRVVVQAVDQQGTPAQAIMTVTVGAPGPSWALLGGGAFVLLLLVAGAFYLVYARRGAERERRRRAASGLRGAGRIPRGGVRPGDPRWGEPRGGGRGSPVATPPGGRTGGRQPAGQRDARRGQGQPSGGRNG
jgi:PKD repeat protein